MNRFENQTFLQQTVVLDGGFYLNCRFVACTLVYTGGEVPMLPGCKYESCTFALHAESERTHTFMRTLYVIGFRNVVDSWIAGITGTPMIPKPADPPPAEAAPEPAPVEADPGEAAQPA